MIIKEAMVVLLNGRASLAAKLSQLRLMFGAVWSRIGARSYLGKLRFESRVPKPFSVLFAT